MCVCVKGVQSNGSLVLPNNKLVYLTNMCCCKVIEDFELMNLNICISCILCTCISGRLFQLLINCISLLEDRTMRMVWEKIKEKLMVLYRIINSGRD